MAEEPKKISFGFSKISKKPAIVFPTKKEEKEIQFIECLEGNSIKLANGEEKEKESLVIPLKNANILRDNMIETLKARRQENRQKRHKEENNSSEEKANGSKQEVEEKPLTLDELAAKEILEELKQNKEKEEAPSIREIPATTISSIGEKESTLEDYDNVPVNEFGLAVLRGMGWAPEKGIGKSGQIVQPVNPVVRPKGLGLGADKVLPAPIISGNEELVMKKNARLKIINGPYKNLYGTIEGFDELPGRLMVRLTLQNQVISISENLVQLVPTEEYNKNSKILNLSDYNKYYEKKDYQNHDGQSKRMGKGETLELKDEKIKMKEGKDRSSPIARKQRDKGSSPSSYIPSNEERHIGSRKIKKNSASSDSESDEQNRKSRKDRIKGETIESNSDRRYVKSKKERQDISSHSDSEEHYKTNKLNRRRSVSSNSDTEKRHFKTVKVERVSPDPYLNVKKKLDKSKGKRQKSSSPSSDSEDQYRNNRKGRRRSRSPVSYAEEGWAKSRRKSQSVSSSSDSEEGYRKKTKRRSMTSDSLVNRKYGKFKERRRSLSRSSEEENRKTKKKKKQRSRSFSSDGERVKKCKKRHPSPRNHHKKKRRERRNPSSDSNTGKRHKKSKKEKKYDSEVDYRKSRKEKKRR